MDDFIQDTFPIVQGHFEKVSDLRYTENVLPPATLNAWIDRDFLFIAAPFFIGVGFRQYWLPLFINYIGKWTNTQDENGNNFNNFLILYWEQRGVWGLAKYYNLFNLEGWKQMNKDLWWRLTCIIFGWELWIILWKLFVNGTLLVNDFEEPPAEG